MVALSVSSDKKQKKNGQYASLQFYRTALCNDFKNGTCPRGDKCTFAHGEDNLCSRPCLTKTKMCPHRSCSKINCGYAHSRKELISTGSFWKTEMCRFGPHCKIKQTCRFAHDDEELRNKTYNGEEISGEEKQKMEDQYYAARQDSFDDPPKSQGSEMKKNNKKTQNNVDLKLSKLMDFIDEDNIDTTIYGSNLSHGDANSGPVMHMFSDEVRSMDNSDYSDLGEQIAALHLMREQVPSNDMWMSGVHNQLFNTPPTPNVLGTLNQLGLTSHINSLSFQQNSTCGVQNNLTTPHINNQTSQQSTEPLWWTVTEDDLVCAMPEYYED